MPLFWPRFVRHLLTASAKIREDQVDTLELGLVTVEVGSHGVESGIESFAGAEKPFCLVCNLLLNRYFLQDISSVTQNTKIYVHG